MHIKCRNGFFVSNGIYISFYLFAIYCDLKFQLHDKLAALPRYDYEKEPVSVCARPQLSNVTEISETEDRQSLNTSISTVKLRPYGVCHKSAFSKACVEEGKGRNESKCLSPVAVDDNSVSCLLVATIGSADESVIKDTLERFPQGKDNTDSILDLLVLEAFQSKSGDREVVESNQENKKAMTHPGAKETEDTGDLKGRTCTVTSNSSHTEESNTEFVEGTQFSNVNFDRRTGATRVLPWKGDAALAKTFDERAVEEFFSQHFAENRNGDVVVSPTLAKRINETSSESSEEFGAGDLVYGTNELVPDMEAGIVKQTEPAVQTYEPVIPDLEVIECVSFILDRICSEFAKPPQVLPDVEGRDNRSIDIVGDDKTTDVSESRRQFVIGSKTTNKKAAKSIKLTFNSNRNTRSTRQRSKLEIARPLEDVKKIDKAHNSTTIKQMDKISGVELSDIVQEKKSIVTNNKQDVIISNPVVRRKRKLYSPKDEKCHEKCVDTEDPIAAEVKSYEQKEPTTFYKQVEQEREEYMKKLRNRKLKSIEMAMLPKPKRLNDAFDDLKNTIEGNEKVILADKTNAKDIAVYNFTSDSEDEDFKKDTVKRKTVTASGDKRKKKNVQSKRKKPILSKTRSKIEKTSDLLEDERMREPVVDILNTSLDQQTSHVARMEEEPPLFILEQTMEPIEESNIPKGDIRSKKTTKKHNKTEKSLSVKEKVKTNITLNDTTDRTESPLPGLLVEATVPHDSITNDTVTANMMLKFQEIYERKSVYESERDSTRNLFQIDSSDVSKALNVTDECGNISKDYLNTAIPSTSKVICSPVRKQKGKRKKSIKAVTDNIENVNKSLFKEREEADVPCEAKGRDRNKNLTSRLTNEERNRATRVLKERNEADSFDNRTQVRSENMSTSIGNKTGPVQSEVINLSGAYSEKSFDTVGNSPITAHGGFDRCVNDVPPSRHSLKKSLEPRNLEVDDLDQSIKDFFTELNKEIAEETFDVRIQKLGGSNSSHSENLEKDKAGARLKFWKEKDDFNKERHIEKRTSKAKSTSSHSKLSDFSNLEEGSNKCSVAKIKSPIVSVTRLSSGDLNKWLKSPARQLDRVEIGQAGQSDKKRNLNRPKGKDRKGKKDDLCKTALFTSSISPIKLFEDLNPINRRDSVSSKSTERGKCGRNLFNAKRTSSPITSVQNAKSDSCEVKSSCDNSVEASRSFTSHINLTSAHERSDNKRRKIESLGSQRLDSGPTISSVNDWFSRIAPVTSQGMYNKKCEITLKNT